jgi:hypothetical protein
MHKNSNAGLLDIILSQYGIEQALIKKYPNLNLKTIDNKEFKEILIKYIKENIELYVNGQKLKIGTGVIKLGNHQTDLKFKVGNLPEDPKYVDVYAPCFQENDKQINFFRLAYKSFNIRAKLSKKNNFESRFIIDENEISIADNNSNNTAIGQILIGSVFLVFIIIIIVIKTKKNNITSK